MLHFVALGTLAAGLLSPVRAADEAVPEQLSPFSDLVRKCEDFEKKTHPLQWGVVWSEAFDRKEADRWNVPPEEAQPQAGPRLRASVTPKVTAETIDQRECAVLDSTGIPSAYQRFGPAVNDDFAIEFVGQPIGDSLCELSILCNGLSRGPGFQFGAMNNTRNVLWYWADTPIPKSMPLPNTPLIEKGRWYTVRLEVKNGMVRGLVDGKLIGESKSAARPGKTYRASMYCRGNKIAVDSIRIESTIRRALPDQRDVDKVFRETFKDQSLEQVKQQIAKLIELLEDQKFPVRDSAGKMLRSVGTLAEPLLREVAESGLPESSARANEILNDIQASRTGGTKPTTAPVAPEPPLMPIRPLDNIELR